MKKICTLILLITIGTTNVSGQCTSPATSYDLTVVSFTMFAPATSMNYTQGYVCAGATLLDSAYCCTRFVNVDSGGTMMVGPSSYGQAFVRSGGTFDGQNSSANWAVFYETGANVINHVGNSQLCPQITFAAGNCTSGFNTVQSARPSATVNGSYLNLAFASSVNAQIELYDVSGKLVRTENVIHSSVCSVNVSDLTSGMYMYRVIQNGEVVSSDKIILGQ